MLFGVPAHTTTLVHAGAWTVTIDSLFGVPARTNAFVHAGAWTVTNDYVHQQCTPRIRTSTYAVPNTVVIMCESYTHIPLHSVPVQKLAVGEISLIAKLWVLLRIDGCSGIAHRGAYNDYVVPRTT